MDTESDIVLDSVSVFLCLKMLPICRKTAAFQRKRELKDAGKVMQRMAVRWSGEGMWERIMESGNNRMVRCGWGHSVFSKWRFWEK